ncbi:polyprenyl synthetase family protein [Amnibacterium kyonggiense]|uniref:Heptaprenyl diphosphate synthase n=1 Tax=Amnibacterium kyonggiense TaxID=595671 RepID=A0A4R7FPH3_9MICO|nr:polyprenyl synthetase family protein [Amnibacterium kyonggiense]TDS79640.1 heptaprenyl diphosphate synthase [Amnibacterium kyonggiense]
MSAREAVAGRSAALSAQLRLSERLFASREDKAMAARIDEGLERVEAGILEQVAFHDQVADVRSRYLLAAGGKRVRPLLTLLTAQLGDGVTDDVVTAAQAVEILHVGSLYHDDVMDEASERRGVPSAQQVWGNSVAILTGDLLFARASKLIAGIEGPGDVLAQAEVFERLVLGQLHETVGPQPDQDPVDHYLQVLEDKTGALIAAAAEWGASYANAPHEYRAPLSTFGRRIGVAFQLIDDVIDLAPDEEDTGKHPGTDLKAGVPTLPLLLLRRRAAAVVEDRPLLARIDALSAEDSDEAVLEVVAELRAHPVTAETREEALRWASSAKAALDALPAGTVRRALIRFADLLVDRSA